MDEPWREGLELPFPGRLRRCGHGVARTAVVRTIAGDHLVLAGVPGLHPELAGELDRRLVRLRTAGEELYRRVLLWGDPDQQVGQPQRRRIGRHRRRGERDLPRLRGSHVDQLLYPVPEIDREDPGETIDVCLAKDVGDPDPIPALEDQRVLAERFHLREIDHHPRRVGYRLLDHRPAPFRFRTTPPSRHRL